MFWKKRNDNVYTVINKELDRLYKFANKCTPDGTALNDVWQRIKLLQDALIVAAEKQPNDAEIIKDLQDTVADLVLVGDKNNE